MREDRQIFLYDDVGCNCGIVDLRTALVVVYAEDVGVLRAVGVALQGAALGAPVGSLHGDAPAEIGARGHFHLAGMRQTLRGSS